MAVSVKTLLEASRPLVDRVGEVLKDRKGEALTLREVALALGEKATPLQFVELEAACKVALVNLCAMRLVNRNDYQGEEHFYWVEPSQG